MWSSAAIQCHTLLRTRSTFECRQAVRAPQRMRSGLASIISTQQRKFSSRSSTTLWTSMGRRNPLRWTSHDATVIALPNSQRHVINRCGASICTLIDLDAEHSVGNYSLFFNSWSLSRFFSYKFPCAMEFRSS